MLARRVIPFLLLATSVVVAAPPGRVPIAELIAHPQRFNGKVVSFVGYYDTGDGHGTSIRASSSDSASRIFLDFQHTTLPLKPLERVQSGSYIRVTGTFRYREMKFTHGKDVDTIVPGFGWMNNYDKEITGITEFVRVDHPRI